MYMFILRPVKHPHGYSAFSEWKKQTFDRTEKLRPYRIRQFYEQNLIRVKKLRVTKTLECSWHLIWLTLIYAPRVLRKCFSITMSMLDNSHTLCSKPHPWQGLILWKLSVLVNSTWRPGIGIRLNAAQGNHLSRFRGCLSRSNIQSCDRVFRTSRFKNQNL